MDTSCAPNENTIELFASRSGCSRVQLSQGQGAEWNDVGEFPFDSEMNKMSALFLYATTQENNIFTKV